MTTAPDVVDPAPAVVPGSGEEADERQPLAELLRDLLALFTRPLAVLRAVAAVLAWAV